MIKSPCDISCKLHSSVKREILEFYYITKDGYFSRTHISAIQEHSVQSNACLYVSLTVFNACYVVMVLGL